MLMAHNFIMLLNYAKNFCFHSICPTSHANSYNERFMKQSSDCLRCHTILHVGDSAMSLVDLLYCMLGTHSNEPG
jgi:hypothetical protein